VSKEIQEFFAWATLRSNLALAACLAAIPPLSSRTVSTLAEIECAVTALPRAQQAELLRFIAARLHEASPPAPARTGAELARLWLTQSHLSEHEAEAFERDLAAISAEGAPQAAPAWE